MAPQTPQVPKTRSQWIGHFSTSTSSLDLFTISSAGSCEVETRPKREAGDVKKMGLENISWEQWWQIDVSSHLADP